MKYQYSKDSKAFKVQQALQSGEVLSASIASKRFGIKNIRAEVARVRANGFVVNTVNRKAANGVVVTEYAAGKPSRELIAAGYKALSVNLLG
jgi:hypothetical protein